MYSITLTEHQQTLTSTAPMPVLRQVGVNSAVVGLPHLRQTLPPPATIAQVARNHALSGQLIVHFHICSINAPCSPTVMEQVCPFALESCPLTCCYLACLLTCCHLACLLTCRHLACLLTCRHLACLLTCSHLAFLLTFMHIGCLLTFRHLS